MSCPPLLKHLHFIMCLTGSVVWNKEGSLKLGRFLNMFISLNSGHPQCYSNSEWCYFSKVFWIFYKLLFIVCWIFVSPMGRYLI